MIGRLVVEIQTALEPLETQSHFYVYCIILNIVLFGTIAHLHVFKHTQENTYIKEYNPSQGKQLNKYNL